MTLTDLPPAPADLQQAELDAIARAREIAQEVLAPNARRHDEAAVFPRENFDALHADGFIGVVVPRRYGGHELSPLAYSQFLKELAKGCASTAGSFHMHNASMRFIDALGTEEQKEHYFREAVEKGALFGSWGAEPTTSWAGKIALNTAFEEAEDGYRVTGAKYFCSLGDGASYGLLYAVPKDKAQQANIDDVQFFLADVAAPGVEIRDEWDPLGMRATVSKPLILDGAFVPELGRLGEPGGIKRIPTEFYSLGYASFYQGIAEAAYDWAIHHAKTRTIKPSNKPIGHFDRIQRKIGDMALSVHTGALAVEHAGRTMGSPSAGGHAVLGSALRAKAITTTVALSVTSLAVEVAGGPGVIRGMPTERYYRDARTAVLMVPGYDQCVETIAKNELGFDTRELG